MSIMKTRRELLRDGLTLAGVAATAGLVGPRTLFAADEAATKTAAAKPAMKGFKIGACDWTIGKAANPAAFDLAKKLGLDGLQVEIGGPPNFPTFKPEVQKQFLAKMKETGLEISTLAMGTLNGNPYVSDPRAQQWVSDTIDACGPLGAFGFLMAFFGRGDLRGDPKKLETLIAKLKEMAPKAEKANVKLLIESQLDAPTLMKVIEGVGSPSIGVYYDVGNTQRLGYDIIKEIHLLGKNIYEFHAKDNNIYGKGQINFPAVRKAMDDIGYRGWIHIEGDRFPNGMEEGCKQDAEYLHQIFPKQV